MNYVKQYSLVYFILQAASLEAIDNPHLYRATNMFLEPRIEHDFLTTLDFTFGSGSTDKSRNRHGSLVPLFDIYGMHTLQNETFSIDGTFSIKEANFFYIQNFIKGIFLQMHVPVRNFQVKDILFFNHLFNDRSLFKKIKDELKEKNIDLQPVNETGAGDFTCMLGFTHNYQETKTLDFIDGTVALGMLAPTGKKRELNNPFSLATGYDGHWGVPLSGRLSLGMYEWITIGTAINSIFFVKNRQNMRLKTQEEEDSLFLSEIGRVTVKKGTVWDAGLFLEADHFIYGLSMMVAYSCAGEQKTTLSTHSSTFNNAFINDDPRLKNWYMHTLHFLAEYDFAKHDSKVGPRIGFFYNYECGGKRVFNTNVVGGSFGIDIGWDM